MSYRFKSSHTAHTAHNSHRASRRSQKGLIAVEIAYAFPFLLLVFMVMLMLSDLMLVRHHMNVSINQAARICASEETTLETRTCVQNWMVVQMERSGVGARCDVRGNINVILQGGVYLSQAQCTYSGFTPLTSIAYLSGGQFDDLNDLLEVVVAAPFPRAL